MAEYRLTPAAERDLEKIWRYTQKTWGIEQAGRYIDTLNSHASHGVAVQQRSSS